MANTQLKECCLCGRQAEVETFLRLRYFLIYTCPNCGKFIAEEMMRFDDRHDSKHRARISALVREQVIQRRDPILLYPSSLQDIPHIKGFFSAEMESLVRSQWPVSVLDRLDRALCNIANSSESIGQRVHVRNEKGEWDTAMMFAESPADAQGIDEMLVSMHLVDLGSPASNKRAVTSTGWRRFEEVTRKRGATDAPAFVAMWFGGDDHKQEMDKMYEEGFKPGVEGAGYRVKRADSEPHNELIMPKIIGDIRIAPFVVADFTENRDGVYYEAGFAEGLDLQVVYTCPKLHSKKTHFDIKQRNMIIYEDNNPDELRDKLREHIRGSIGEGPNIRSASGESA